MTGRPSTGWRRVLCALLLVGAMLAAGCSARAGGSAQSPAARHGPSAAVHLGPPATTTTTEPLLPVAPVQWAPCGSLQCGSVTVPLDYSQPQGATLQIAVARHPAETPSSRIGALVINPGGPGGSGIDDLSNEMSVLPADLLDRFDVVSFDPRGVERSSPVNCAAGPGSGSASGPEIDPVPPTVGQQQQLLQSDRQFAGACEQGSGAILPFVGTVDSARDLDRIRQAVGDAGLTFIGHSYGTLLGATYAELFPTHVRAMVLDGAIDPALTTAQYVTDQADSLEAELQSFFAWCAGAGCAWRPSGDPTAALLALLQQVAARPLQAGGASVGAGTIYDTLLAGLEAQSSWPSLASALAGAASGSGTAANSMATRYDRGGSSNGAEAERAIDCLDHPTDRDPSTYPSLAAQVGQTAPVFGPLLAWGLLGCAIWPALPTRTPAPASDPGAPPILVVGTSGDPVTPYKWSVALAGELSGGVLLTWQGRSHVAYFYSSCVRAAYASYLVSGVAPAPGTTCPG